MNNLNILIAEDAIPVQNMITSAIHTINDSYNVFTAVSADDGWQIAQENHIHLFILDIGLIGSTGFQLAEKIRQSQEYIYTPIIFETIDPMPIFSAAFKYRYVDYIVKPIPQEYLIERLKVIFDAVKRSINNKTYIDVKMNDTVIKIDFDEIIYISAILHGSMIYAINKTYSTSNTLKMIENELCHRFIHCHKSYIVNYFHVEKFDFAHGCVILKGLTKNLPIGRTYKKEIINAACDLQ